MANLFVGDVVFIDPFERYEKIQTGFAIVMYLRVIRRWSLSLPIVFSMPNEENAMRALPKEIKTLTFYPRKVLQLV